MADMTKREFLNAVIESTVDENIKEFAQNELAKMDTANAKRREKASEKNASKIEEVKAFVGNFLNGEAQTASDLVAKMVAAGYERADEKAVNVQYVSSLCRKAVDLGLAEATEIKVAKKGIQKAYTLV